MSYQLLDRFRSLFEGTKYEHRNSTLGDQVASFLFEDLCALKKSTKFCAAVESQSHVLNRKNRAVGQAFRRGDGTFGERIPHVAAEPIANYSVALGEVATVEIGVEVKILAKAMIKQIDRVCTDMINQAAEFRAHGGKPICVGIVGINAANAYTSYEGDAVWPTDGRRRKHPAQEAMDAEARLLNRAKPAFDEFLVLRFRASNVPPYSFSWVDYQETQDQYGASLVRLSRLYESRF